MHLQPDESQRTGPSVFWLFQAAGWSAFGFSMFLAAVPFWPVWYAALSKIVLALMGALFTWPLRHLYRSVWNQSPSYTRIILICGLASLVVAMPWTVCSRFLIEWFASVYTGESFGLANWYGLFNGALYHAFALLAWSGLYFGIKHYRLIQRQREQLLRAEADAQAARLEALRYQINPHFLFNTLNAVSTLVVEQRNEAARRMLARLSDLLRLTLESAPQSEVPLAQEIDFIKRYLEIEQLRFGDRLQVHMDVAPETLVAYVPNLVMQPLVENAVRHGIGRKEEGGRLEIETRKIRDRVLIQLRDNGAGMVGGKKDGIGLANTRARLQKMYGSDHQFTLHRADGGGVTVTILIPFRKVPLVTNPMNQEVSV